MSAISSKLGLCRGSLIVLSLLLGCDYLPQGVGGVGVTGAVALLAYWKEGGYQPLER